MRTSDDQTVTSHQAMVVSDSRRTVLAQLFADAALHFGSESLVISNVRVATAGSMVIATADFTRR